MRYIFFIACLLSIRAYSQDTTRLSLLFLGDIMQHGTQISDAYEPATKSYNYAPCFQYVKPYIQSADIAIGNLELTLAGPPYTGYPQFSAPDELIAAFKESGMDVLVTANNHCADKGKKGLERTLEMLDSFKILHTGTFSDEVEKLNTHPLCIEKNGFKLSLLNYTFSTNGLPVFKPNIVNMIDTAVIRKDLQKAKKTKPDAIIVFTHWGAEYQSLPSAWQKQITEFCFRHGAQLVIGAHPHVLQPMEWRKEKNQLVAYSLGNFVSGQRKRYTDGGGMITVELKKIYQSHDSVTSIDKAEYILEWVYRTADAEKNYYVLPVPKFENDTTNFIADVNSRAAFKTFVEDSRGLLGKHNLNVSESTTIPSDTLTTYKVLVLKTKESGESAWTVLPPVPYGLNPEKDGEGNILFFSGDFTDKTQAVKYSDKLIQQLGYKEAQVIEYKNGKRVN